MKAWQVDSWCEPDGMHFRDIPRPEPAAGQVRIRHYAASVNFFDLLQIQGKYQIKPPMPFTPGAEASGVVDVAGDGVRGLRAGDRVAAILAGGAFAEYSVVPDHRVFRVPDTLGDGEAAALPVVYQTSLFALEGRANLRAGEWLLVHAGASGVGMAAIQIGQAMGARVIATAGSKEKLDFIRSQGVEFAVDYRDPKWIEGIKGITAGRGADVIYDPVGGDVFDQSTRCLASEGRLLVVGFASGRIPSIAANRILLKDISIVGVHWGAYMDRNPEHFQVLHHRLMDLYQAGKIRPVVSATYPPVEVPAALKAIGNRQVIGKIVIGPW